jgi:hypothetical protein
VRWLLRSYRGYVVPVTNVELGLMSDPKVKERLLDAVRDLPDDATVEDAMERRYFLALSRRTVGPTDSPTLITR